MLSLKKAYLYCTWVDSEIIIIFFLFLCIVFAHLSGQGRTRVKQLICLLDTAYILINFLIFFFFKMEEVGGG